MTSKIFAGALVAVTVLGPLPLPAQSPTPGAGQPVLTFVNRLLINPPQVLVYGYFPTIAGISGNLFSGTAGESTAYFTWTLNAPGGVTLHNAPGDAAGNTSVVALPAGETLNIYYNANPNQDWNMPSTFSSGVLVATLRSSLGGQTTTGGVSLVTQSYLFESSADFTHQGVTYNFRRIIPRGITMVTLQSNVPLNAATAPPLTFTAAGTAFAVGGPLSVLPWLF